LKLLLDINVILDVVLSRIPWMGEAARLLTAVESGQADGYIAAHTLTTIHYYVAKHRGRVAAISFVTDLLRIVRVVPVGGADFPQGLFWALMILRTQCKPSPLCRSGPTISSQGTRETSTKNSWRSALLVKWSHYYEELLQIMMPSNLASKA
jgi:hypothetical protein